MANKDKTEIIIVVDRSGSMQSIKKDMEGGFQTFIGKQREEPGECLVTLHQFDSEYDTLYEARPIKDVGPYALVPRGRTALLDAVGKSIAKTVERHSALAEVDKPAAVIFLIITDGAENSSSEWTRPKVQAAIKDAEEERNWQIMYLAADAEAFRDGGRMGVDTKKLGQFAKSTKGVAAAYGASSSASTRYRSAVRSGDMDAKLSVDKDDLSS